MESFNVIYGAGKVGKCVYKILIEKNIKIDYFVDNFKEGFLFNIPIIKPQELPKNSNVFVAISYNFPDDKNYVKYLRKYVPEVVPETNLLNVKRIISFEDILKNFPEIIDYYMNEFIIKPKRLFMQDRNLNFLVYKDKIKNFLKDEKSKCIFEKIINFYLNPNFKNYIFPDKTIQYFPNDLPLSLENVETFIDCGAYIGDTLFSAIYFCKNLKNILCFEPNVKNLKSLDRKVKLIKKNINIILIPAGNYSKFTKLKILGEGSSCKVVEDENGSILGYPLDSLNINSIDYIKMDVEGSELEALKGAKNIIKIHKPILAVSIYHSFKDLFLIPKYLIENYRHLYDFYIRLHGHFGLELVLYCIPKN